MIKQTVTHILLFALTFLILTNKVLCLIWLIGSAILALKQLYEERKIRSMD